MSHPPRASSPVPSTPTRVLLLAALVAGLLPFGVRPRPTNAAIDHLVVSEVVTGGAGASDELIEIYNPSSAALPLEGLELVYVSATGGTISRRAAWGLGAPPMPAGSHLLVANELGAFAPIADVLYVSGMAATGGSVALRIQGAGGAIDAVGWGTAASTWLEGAPAPAPPAGASIERLPGGAAGSTTDTDDNAADFVVREVPDPQNSGSAPVPDPDPPSPSPSAVPTATPTPTGSAVPSPSPSTAPSASPTPTATPVPGPAPISISAARSQPDGTIVTVEGVALAGSVFADGGGYLADATGGIAVLLEAGAFARGERLRITGEVDDRFAQRTIRAGAGDVIVVGSGEDPPPVRRVTGAIDESVEAMLVAIDGVIDGSPTLLTGGLAFDVDDGSGPARVIVGSATGIDTATWSDGRSVSVVGVVGQRDSSGTGNSGYRVQPRDPDDVERVANPTPSGSATPSPRPSGTAGPSPAPDGQVTSIAAARAAPKLARLTVQGVVTLASGTVDEGSAVIQDPTGAILLRLGDEAGLISLGQLVEVDGVRSTKSGMETLRVSLPPRQLGTAPGPTPRPLRTGDAAEELEARFVVVRGALLASARRASSGTVSFEIDDGSGPLRVVLGSALAAEDDALLAGTWVEVRGVLGQETTGAQPTRGYRVWPSRADDLRIVAGATDAGAASGAGASSSGGFSSAGPTSLGAVDGGGDLAELRVGATLVVAAWPELDVGGLLWDGGRIVAVDPASVDAIRRSVGAASLPVALELAHLRAVGRHAGLGVPLVALGRDGTDTMVLATVPHAPATELPQAGSPPAWVSIVGSLAGGGSQRTMEVGGSPVAVQIACGRPVGVETDVVSLTGVALGDPARILVPCDGIRAAPTLVLGSGSDGRVLTRHDDVGAAPVATQAASDDRRGTAAGLLGAGALVIVVAVVARLRRWPPDHEQPDVEDPDGDGSATAEARLTLVRVPHEHDR